MAEKITWTSETRKIVEIKPAKYNPRKATKEQKDQLRKSLEKFSLADPLVINKNGNLIGGHQRLAILKERGDKEVEVRVPNRLLDLAEEQELNVRLNKNLMEFDLDLLIKLDLPMLLEVGFLQEELGKFNPVDMEFQAKLDQKAKLKCPACGHEFTA